MPGASSPRASNRTFQCGFSAESCPPRSTHTSPLASLAISRHPRSRRTRRTGRPLDVDRRAREGPRGRRGKTRSCGSRCPPPAHRNPRQYPSSCPPTLVSASLSASVARSRLLLWWWLAHCEVEGQLVGAAIGQVHPLAAVWAHQVGRPRTAAKGLDDLLLLGRHLFTLPQLCSISTRCADWPSTISQTTWGAMPLGRSAGRSPRLLHRILVLQPRSCWWRSISPRTSLGGSSSPVLARRASPGRRPDRSGGSAPASADPVAPATRSRHRSWVVLALGSSSPATACACSPTWTLTRLTTRSRSASSHRRCLEPPPPPCRAAPTPRGSGISTGQLLRS
jgi:hypothetical protein